MLVDGIYDWFGPRGESNAKAGGEYLREAVESQNTASDRKDLWLKLEVRLGSWRGTIIEEVIRVICRPQGQLNYKHDVLEGSTFEYQEVVLFGEL